MKTILIGLDAFDPKKFEHLAEQGKLPNLSKYIEAKGYSRFNVTNPAQSEVSWTSIATGLNPGGHGLFDFVHRNPKNYGINVSLLPAKQSLIGLQFAPPHEAQTMFDFAVEKGYPATSLWWPATFPAKLTSPVFTIPGLGTPDIQGKLGVGILFSTEELSKNTLEKTQLEKLSPGKSSRQFSGRLTGPPNAKGKETFLEFSLNFTDPETAEFSIGKNKPTTLRVGEWSPTFEISFKMNIVIQLKAVTRVILTQGEQNPRLYFLPLQIHPLSSAWPYASPRNLIKKTWTDNGPFLTLGWPQDTTGLDEGITTDDQFLALCNSIVATREQVFYSQLQNFREGVLGIVFDTLDRVQHMLWSNRPDIIEDWYIKLDSLIGRIENKIQQTNNSDAKIIIVSDHGFAEYKYKVNLNKWLLDEDFLAVNGDGNSLNSVNWDQTTAYAIGLNSLYLNLAGREGKGILTADQKTAHLEKIRNALLQWEGPDGQRVVTTAASNEEAFEGPLSNRGPDLLVGYTPGYRASADTGLGRWNNNVIEENLDHWNADHCIDPGSVQGVLFANQDLTNYPNPSYKDIPPLAVGASMKAAKPPKDDDYTEEDQDAVEERLKGLGYL
jgi:predicted AlkP superfamily phosphohydrolase/phosphomutase